MFDKTGGAMDMRIKAASIARLAMFPAVPYQYIYLSDLLSLFSRVCNAENFPQVASKENTWRCPRVVDQINAVCAREKHCLGKIDGRIPV